MFDTDAYVLHVRCAHREVQEAIRQVHLVLDQSSGLPSGTKVVRGLDRLKHGLSRHFSEEEQGGKKDKRFAHLHDSLVFGAQFASVMCSMAQFRRHSS